MFADGKSSPKAKRPTGKLAPSGKVNTAPKRPKVTPGKAKPTPAAPVVTSRKQVSKATPGKAKPTPATPMVTSEKQASTATTGESKPTPATPTATASKLVSSTISPTAQTTTEGPISHMSLLSPCTPLTLFNSLLLFLTSCMLL
uniref:Uncharacterized protein n=1 Tax=Echinococcus granulosus TaxID=6210 RepID=A0A068W9D7_ECHGR|nr:hypothetical protein EgrG_002012200 [Echinococcus granulosus]